MRRAGLVTLGLLILAIGVLASIVRVVPTGTTPPAPPSQVAAASPPLPPAAPAGLLAVPVVGVTRAQIQDNWGDPRDNGKRLHHGDDIPAPAGTPITAAGPGRIEKLFQSARGGTTLYERSADGRWIYYYAHLSGYAPGVHEGQAVRAGDALGFVGDTGDAGPGNFHLHFGLTRMGPSDKWWQGTDIDPYPYLAGKPAPR